MTTIQIQFPFTAIALGDSDQVESVYVEAHALVNSILEESANIVGSQLADTMIPNGNLVIKTPGINVIVKSPTIESLPNSSFECESDYTGATPSPVTVTSNADRPKPKRRFVFTDSKDSDDDQKPKVVTERERKQPSSKVDGKFESLSSEIDDIEMNEEQYRQDFDAAFDDVKDEVSALQSEFSKLSYDETNSAATGADSATPDNDLQGEYSRCDILT